MKTTYIIKKYGGCNIDRIICDGRFSTYLQEGDEVVYLGDNSQCEHFDGVKKIKVRYVNHAIGSQIVCEKILSQSYEMELIDKELFEI